MLDISLALIKLQVFTLIVSQTDCLGLDYTLLLFFFKYFSPESFRCIIKDHSDKCINYADCMMKYLIQNMQYENRTKTSYDRKDTFKINPRVNCQE